MVGDGFSTLKIERGGGEGKREGFTSFDGWVVEDSEQLRDVEGRGPPRLLPIAGWSGGRWPQRRVPQRAMHAMGRGRRAPRPQADGKLLTPITRVARPHQRWLPRRSLLRPHPNPLRRVPCDLTRGSRETQSSRRWGPRLVMATGKNTKTPPSPTGVVHTLAHPPPRARLAVGPARPHSEHNPPADARITLHLARTSPILKYPDPTPPFPPTPSYDPFCNLNFNGQTSIIIIMSTSLTCFSVAPISFRTLLKCIKLAEKRKRTK
ncbi:hypothetical protein BHE74_00025927 [Ensete ventricosum]|nr:hypothetical protein BHE74_00025927 [Ensete ventricosum]